MMLFYSEKNKIKYFLDPPKKNRRRDMNGRDMALSTCVCLYQQPVTWSFTRSRLSDSAQSNPFIKDYYLIIVAYSRPHFSIYNIFIQKKVHLVSTKGPLTLKEKYTQFHLTVKMKD